MSSPAITACPRDRRWSLLPTLALPVVAVAASALAWERMFVWLLIGGVFYVWLLVSLLGMHLRAKRPSGGRWQMSLRRLLLNVSVFCCLLSVLTTDWPFRLRFALSQSQIDALADRVQSGQSVTAPSYAGFFQIRAAEANRAGQPCLWVCLAPGGNTGLVRCRPETQPALNLASSLPLGNGWYLVSED